MAETANAYTATQDGDAGPLNMREVADALNAAVNDTSDQNLNVLMKASNFDIRSLATLAIDDRNTPKSAALLLSAAVMLSESKAKGAETRATEAEVKATEAETKATEAETKATEANHQASEAQRRARTAENNSDGVLLCNHEHTHTLISQRSQLGELEHRVAALASLPPLTTSSDDAGRDDSEVMALRRALAGTSSRLQILEHKMERLMERYGDV